MLGTIVNTFCIILGSLFGSRLKKGINPQYQNSMFTAMGLAACAIGINGIANYMPKSEYPVLFIISLAAGSLFGTVMNLDGKFNAVVNSHSSSENNLGQGLATGILMYCIGTLSILGPVMAAVNKDYTFLFTNATLDLITSTVLASTYGVGMVFAAPVLFCWQGSIYLVAKYLSATFFSATLLAELSVVGGIIIFGSGLGMLQIKDCKTLNMLPSIAIPILFFVVKGFFS